MKPHIRIIGDVHGKVSFRGVGRSYSNLISKAEYSVQLGDLGYGEPTRMPDFHERVGKIDKTKHFVVLGNHDDYDHRVPNALGDFGMHSIPLREGTFDFFYIRGAWSIDKSSRLIGVDWWPTEELDWEQGQDCVAAYVANKPRTVMSHDCPEEIIYLLANTGKNRFLTTDFHPSRTHQILQSCWEQHHPELWIFGHHHINWRYDYKGTTFMCLEELGFVDFDDMGHLLTPRPQ